MKKILLYWILSLGAVATAHAQMRVDTASASTSILDRKFYWGLTFNNSWTNVTGSQEPYFLKPSLGGGLKCEYFISPKWGVSWGLTYQQRGAGIKTPDNEQGVGNADTTNRLRLRFNSLEIPLAIVYRSKALGKGQGVRLTAGLGITPQYVFRTSRFFASVEDGFHIIDDNTVNYARFNASIDANIGVLINAGNSAIYQVDLLGGYGLMNVYNNRDWFGDAQGRNILLGLRLTYVFSNFKF